MIDMSAWEEINVDVVDELYLDPKNVRIDLQGTLLEADIVQDLFHNEKALTLVESICKVGLLTHEVPIALKREGQLVVVEGNRRIAALKAMQNPFLAPEYQARIKRATQNVSLDAFRRISVKLAPNQDDANQLIAAIHTGNQRVGWSPARQSAFFQAQIDAGKSPEYLISHYPTVEVKKFIIRSRILKLFRDAKYQDPQLADYVDTRNFPVSVLARLYAYEEFLLLAQIRVNEQTASVELGSTDEQFATIAEKVVGDIKNKNINTRTLNSTKSQSYIDYMNELRNLVTSGGIIPKEAPPIIRSPQPTTGVSQSTINAPVSSPTQPPLPAAGTSATPTSKSQSSPQPSLGTNTPQTKPNAPQKEKEPGPNYLNFSQIKIDPSYPPSIRKICEELAVINVKKFPNATLDLIRTFLEKSIKAYAEKLNVDLKAHAGKQAGGYVQLGNCLNWLEEYVKSTKKTPFIQVIQKIRGNKIGGYIPTIDHMNAINHNHHVFATPDEVKACWDGMEGLIRMVLKP
ncbi:hypothetical protein SSPS47_16430 [Streptomyces sp. S4.7]|uniref:hypothetical protein n=1 Tax=Streptomyces sp. S4.7 TaxID=2705439 RepID=UPI0013985BF4|nr:hypothetical protein [Streptomyces sp. S4.7]QHY96694.1 hypothetical protein SSPS47_16430 [Streptomyces sp. S4.7]